MFGMFDVSESLHDALDRARSNLKAAQDSVALANAGRMTGRSADSAMAQCAQAAIFSEALLAVERSRFEAIKAVTK